MNLKHRISSSLAWVNFIFLALISLTTLMFLLMVAFYVATDQAKTIDDYVQTQPVQVNKDQRDTPNSYLVLTKNDVLASPRLQELKAKAGDFIYTDAEGEKHFFPTENIELREKRESIKRMGFTLSAPMQILFSLMGIMMALIYLINFLLVGELRVLPWIHKQN